MTRWLIHIDAPRLRGAPCFALVVARGRVVEAPPIASWAAGKKLWPVLRWYLLRGASIQGMDTTAATDQRDDDLVTYELHVTP